MGFLMCGSSYLARLCVPKLEVIIVRAADKLPPIVAERDILDRLYDT
jgi:hypothetical protein